jgi:CBS-domain-containing membrane protein
MSLKEYSVLPLAMFKAGSTYARPTQKLPEHVKLSDPATDVMTDLSKVALVNVRPMTSIEQANAKMIRFEVRMALVLDVKDQVFGLLTATDVLGEKPTRFLQNMGGEYADILVRDIMTTQRQLEVLKMADIKNAKVGQIVATLKQAHRQHGLVVDEGADGKQTVCGVFSMAQIARQLGVSDWRTL